MVLVSRAVKTTGGNEARNGGTRERERWRLAKGRMARVASLAAGQWYQNLGGKWKWRRWWGTVFMTSAAHKEGEETEAGGRESAKGEKRGGKQE